MTQDQTSAKAVAALTPPSCSTQQRFRIKKRQGAGVDGDCQRCGSPTVLLYFNGMLFCSKCKKEAARHSHEQITKRNTAFVTSQKEGKPCVDCGGNFPHYVMDFDHIDASNKRLSVAALVSLKYSLESIQAEISKCELVCSNCHRERTWRRAHGSSI